MSRTTRHIPQWISSEDEAIANIIKDGWYYGRRYTNNVRKDNRYEALLRDRWRNGYDNKPHSSLYEDGGWKEEVCSPRLRRLWKARFHRKNRRKPLVWEE